MRRTNLMAATGVLAAIAFLAGDLADVRILRLAAKPLPVLMLAAWVWRFGPGRYGRLVTAGLLICAGGDVLLEIDDQTFVAGVGAFLVGHLFYIAAFVFETREPHLVRAVPFAVWGVAVLWGLQDGLERQGTTVPVAIYTLTICTMLWRAAARVSRLDNRATIAFFGALLFAGSDTLLAVNRFGFPTPGAGFLIVLSYWAGQTAIALSTADDADSREDFC